MDKLWIDAVTIAIALLGAVLGVVNTWWAMTRDRVRLVVTSGTARPTEGGDPRLYIEVINTGYVAVTIKEVGFSGRRPSKAKSRAAIVTDAAGKVVFPYRLEPRASFSTYASTTAHHHPLMATVTHAYAKTACQLWFAGRCKFVSAMAMKAQAAIGRAPAVR